jgi:hypothetical protein
VVPRAPGPTVPAYEQVDHLRRGAEVHPAEGLELDPQPQKVPVDEIGVGVG